MAEKQVFYVGDKVQIVDCLDGKGVAKKTYGYNTYIVKGIDGTAMSSSGEFFFPYSLEPEPGFGRLYWAPEFLALVKRFNDPEVDKIFNSIRKEVTHGKI